MPRKKKIVRTPTPPEQVAPLPVDPEETTPPPGAGHLPPLPRETANQHRAFLLWAMMVPDRRSYRGVARAINVGDITIRRWAAKYRWLDRVKLESSDRLAWQEYLSRYVEVYGLEGISVVQDNMDFPGPLTPFAVIRARLGPDADARAYPPGSTARRVLEAASEMSRQVMGDPMHDPDPLEGSQLPEQADLLTDQELAEDDLEDPEIDPISDPSSNPKMEKNPKSGKSERSEGRSSQDDTPETKEELADPATKKSRVQDFKKLINATLSVYAKDLIDKKVKVSPRDAVLMIELEQALADAPSQAGASQGPKESVRVRTAREQGDDVLAALEQDLRELDVIAGALRQKRSQEVEHLRAEMERSEQVIQLRENEAKAR